MEAWEREEVLTRMHEFGVDNVRGWMYTFKTMPMEHKLSAFDQVCEMLDLCRKCGRNDHFVRDCTALSTDLWACGLELRVMHDQAESERRIAEAKRIMAEASAAAARVLAGE
jgi:hypothetical protein